MSSYSYQRGLSRLEILVSILATLVILIVIFSFTSPRRPYSGHRVEALNNAKAIAGGLVAFRSDYGAYPCDETRRILTENGFENIPSGNDANAYLAQLIVTDIIDSEAYFYASGVKGARKGDDLKKGNQLLARGENCLAYVMTKNGSPLSDIQSHTPLVLAPLKSGGSNPTFDPGPYADRFVYGAVDGSGKVREIGKTGLPLSKGRIHLFQTGPDSLYGDETPVVKYPLGIKPPTSPSNK